MTNRQDKPVLGLFIGDPSGIGPEITAKLLSDPKAMEVANIIVIGDRRILELGQKIAKVDQRVDEIDSVENASWDSNVPCLLHHDMISPDEFTIGQLSPQVGKAVVETLTFSADLLEQGKIDGLVFAPLNKENMRLGGSPFESELHLFKKKFNFTGFAAELGVLEGLWTSRVSSHCPLKEVHTFITKERVVEAIELIHESLVKYGVENPRIAVAAINPHAGEGGLFGTEEMEHITPAVDYVNSKGINAKGPLPADTLFVLAQDGRYDAVVSMYHDQGQIAMKLMGFDQGVAVAGGIPKPIATPAHGTAFDIAGNGVANYDAIRNALFIASRMAANQKKTK